MIKITQDAIRQLNDRTSRHPSVVATRELRESLDAWEAAGRPYTWEAVEQFEQYVLCLDYSYGMSALFENGKLVRFFKYMESYKDIVCLDRDYYGVSQYIWRKA